MANPGNRHCVTCIGALSVPIGRMLTVTQWGKVCCLQLPRRAGDPVSRDSGCAAVWRIIVRRVHTAGALTPLHRD